MNTSCGSISAWPMPRTSSWRVIAIPALGPWEHALGIKRDAERYWIFYVAPQRLIGRRWEDASARDFPKTTREVAIDRFAAEEIHTIWTRVVKATRYPETTTIGLDGTRYHFSVHVYGNVSYGGQIWSPPEHTLTGKARRALRSDEGLLPARRRRATTLSRSHVSRNDCLVTLPAPLNPPVSKNIP